MDTGRSSVIDGVKAVTGPSIRLTRWLVFALWSISLAPAAIYLANRCAQHMLATSAYFEVLWLYRVVFTGFVLLIACLVLITHPLFLSSDRRLVRAIRTGLRNGEFHIAYQPIVDLISGATIGAEALVRWTHPTLGIVSPSRFMPVLESSPHLHELTRFVLERTVLDMCGHRPEQPRKLSINLCARDIENASAVADLLSFKARLPANTTLVIEFTERVLFADHETTHHVLDRLKSAGIKLAVDDFGTKCNNIDLLTRFPFDFVKIDRQFVAALDHEDTDVFAHMLAIARHFKTSVVAEGVETLSQHNALLQAGVVLGQGYFYGRPLSSEAFFRTEASPAITPPRFYRAAIIH